jgi:hypothetical protein
MDRINEEYSRMRNPKPIRTIFNGRDYALLGLKFGSDGRFT